MSKVRTILDDIDASELGFTMAHEHLWNTYSQPRWQPSLDGGFEHRRT